MEYEGIDSELLEFLEHHGIKGQKWYVRRYQNSDGTLTEEGKKRYSTLNEREKKKVDKVINKRDGAANLVINATSYVKTLNRAPKDDPRADYAYKLNYDAAISGLKQYKKAEDYLSRYSDVPMSKLDDSSYSYLKTYYKDSPYNKKT